MISPIDKTCVVIDSHPTDQALIEHHLRPWVAGSGRSEAPSFVHEADIYAAAPARLARTFAPAVSRDGERAWYFLTRLRLKSPRGRGRRFARTVGGGCWHGEAKERPVLDSLAGGRPVGRRQFFSFVKAGRGGTKVRTGWIMSELRLVPGDRVEDLRVLCKVYRSPRHPAEPSDSEPTVVNGRAEEDGSTAAPPARHGNSDGEDGSTAEPPARHGNSDAEDGSTAAPPARHGNSDGDVTAAPPSSPGNKAASNDEGSTETSAATRKRQAADGDEQSSDAARKRRKAGGIDANSGAPGTGFNCPQCGCGLHLDVAVQAVVPVPNSEPETGRVQVVHGDSELKDHTLFNFI